MVEAFAVGDVVQLKSGGVAMTVEKVDGDDISCVWSEGKQVQKATFASGALRKYKRRSARIKVL